MALFLVQLCVQSLPFPPVPGQGKARIWFPLCQPGEVARTASGEGQECGGEVTGSPWILGSRHLLRAWT